MVNIHMMTCSKGHCISFTIYDSSMLTRKNRNLNDGASAHLTESSTVTQHSCTLWWLFTIRRNLVTGNLWPVQHWLEPVREHKRGTTMTTIKLLSVRSFLFYHVLSPGYYCFHTSEIIKAGVLQNNSISRWTVYETLTEIFWQKRFLLGWW